MDEAVRREMILAAPIETVWGAIATPEGLAAWLGGSSVDVDARSDGPICVRWPDGSASRGLVEAVEPPHLFVFRWRRLFGAGIATRAGQLTRVRIELEPDGRGGTRIAVTEAPGWTSILSEATG